MFYVITIAFIFAFLLQNLYFIKRLKQERQSKRFALLQKHKSLESINKAVSIRFDELERKISDAFFVYELARDISPILDKAKLLNIFEEKLKIFSTKLELYFLNQLKDGFLNYEIKSQEPRYFCVKTLSNRVKECLPIFLHQLNLCLERINLYKKLQDLSINDSLTRVYNRRYFMERFLEEFQRSKKFNLNISFLMVDLDHFKNINDTYGHIVGDVILREAAKILKENIREIDFVARVGGEEFAVILTETSKEGAIMVANRIVEKVSSEKIKAFDELVAATVSIGVATYPDNTSHQDMLIEIADRALYKAKESGRNLVSWF